MGFPTFTWPDWKQAKTGTKFVHIRTGRTGTLIRPGRNPHNGAIVVWDGTLRGRSQRRTATDVPRIHLCPMRATSRPL